MTVFMTLIGLLVFIPSLFTAGFKTAFKRLWMFALTGFAVDLFIVGVSIAVSMALTY